MVIPNINTEAINTNKIIEMKIRDRKDIFFSKSNTFRSKLTNIAPKKVRVQNWDIVLDILKIILYCLINENCSLLFKNDSSIIFAKSYVKNHSHW